MNTPTIEEVAAVSGLKYESARKRLYKYKNGSISFDELMRRKDTKEGKGNAEWRALGNRPHTDRLKAIKGTTAWERSNIKQYDIVETKEPPGKKRGDFVRDIVRKTGIARSSAFERLKRYEAGNIGIKELYAPRKH